MNEWTDCMIIQFIIICEFNPINRIWMKLNDAIDWAMQLCIHLSANQKPNRQLVKERCYTAAMNKRNCPIYRKKCSSHEWTKWNFRSMNHGIRKKIDRFDETHTLLSIEYIVYKRQFTFFFFSWQQSPHDFRKSSFLSLSLTQSLFISK